MPLPASLDGVCTVRLVRGAAADPASTPDLLIELPHGATRTADYDRLRARLHGTYDDDLVDFFHVNTDIGSPELADDLAAALVAAHPTRAVGILQSRIPRTFIDCNRVIDAPAAAFREGKVTPGVPPWVRDPRDLELLREMHEAYVVAARAAIDGVCGAGGAALLLHTYAPRSVGVEVDEHIVASLHAAYRPETVGSWPLRPPVDVIGRSLEGELLVDPTLLDDLHAGYAALGVHVANGETYPLHPSTWGFHHAAHWPLRTLCVEVRRDLLADPWDPFVEMRISAAHAARMAGPLAGAIGSWLERLT
ncbi:MAG: N-formylglutamate amidohydrolase [Pseudomonadota bacterium]|nr:N-formylglutamate amidohydrolase [Pseudomonadota bacterium]